MLFSSAAIAEFVGEKTGVNSVLGVAPKTSDFVTEAAESDMTEIELPRPLFRRVTRKKNSSPIRWCATIVRLARN